MGGYYFATIAGLSLRSHSLAILHCVLQSRVGFDLWRKGRIF